MHKYAILLVPLFLALVLIEAIAPAQAQQQPPPAPTAEALIEAARAALAKGALDDAETLLQGVEPDEGNIDDLDFLHGSIALNRGDWQTAIARFRAMLIRNPDLPRVRLDLAFAHFQAGEDGRAVHHFRLALGTKDLPPVVRERALVFLDRIRRRKSWSITGSLALAPDS
ncbi:MAG: tetratricopeptide repeat protein, partial [Alphaproteobacteria bacterium]|nr:tetratricopeptide repeat protein [Alphaproteobacteria bacterium]